MTTCLHCDKKVHARGMCRSHYEKDRYRKNPDAQRERQRRYESTPKGRAKRQESKEAFYDRHPKRYARINCKSCNSRKNATPMLEWLANGN